MYLSMELPVRGATAKEIRRAAKARAISWYESILPTDEPVPAGDELYSYVVDRDYFKAEDGVVSVSPHTKRKFYLEEKRSWKQEYYQCLKH